MANNTLISIADGNVTDSGVYGYTLEYGDAKNGTSILNLSNTNLYGLPLTASSNDSIIGLVLPDLVVNINPNSTSTFNVNMVINGNQTTFSYPITSFNSGSYLVKFPNPINVSTNDLISFNLRNTGTDQVSILCESISGALTNVAGVGSSIINSYTNIINDPDNTPFNSSKKEPSFKVGTSTYSTINSSTLHSRISSLTNYTFEGWYYFSGNEDNGNIVWINGSSNMLGYYGFTLAVDGGVLKALIANNNATNWQTRLGSFNLTVPLSTWCHVALVVTSTNAICYLNGVAGTTIPITQTLAGNGYSFIFAPANRITSNVRISNGQVYTANFNNTSVITDPTPFIPNGNTVLLIKAGINYNKSILSNTLNDDFFNASTVTANFSSNMPLLTADNPFNDPTKSSLYTDGSTRTMGINDPTGNNFTLSANDFTLDFWAKPASSGISNVMFSHSYPNNFNGIFAGQDTATNSFIVQLGAGSSWNISRINIATNTSLSSLSAPLLNNWSQFTINKKHGFVTVYRNGQIIDNFISSTALTNSSSAVFVGGRFLNSQIYNGLLYNVHLVNGTALYPIDFTPPSSPLSANSDTLLMMHTQDVSGNRVDDTSNNNLFFYNNRGTLTALNPFNDPTKNSLAFDGITNRLKIAPSATNDFVLSSGDFTLDLWVYPRSTSVDNAAIINSANPTDQQGFYINTRSTANSLTYGVGDGTWASSAILSAYNTTNPYLSTPILSNWSQLTLSRRRNIFNLYRNGQIIYSINSSKTLTNTNSSIYIGRTSSNAQFGNILVSNVRLVKGTNLYETDYTVSTVPLTATPETTLLLRSSSTSAVDTSNYNNVIYNNRGTLTANNPFNDPNEKSLYYDGLSNRLRVLTAGNAFNLSANNFTIELFVYPVSSRNSAFITTADTNNFQGIWLGQVSDTQFEWGVGNGSAWAVDRILSAQSLSSKWNHITLNRAGSTFYTSINGAITDVWNVSGATLTLTNTNSSITIGGRPTSNQWSNTYISNVNFINGSVKYPLTSFATPTVALTTVSGTVCLVNGTGTIDGTNGDFIDSSSNNYVISSFGGASQSKFGPNNTSNGFFNSPTDYLIVKTPNRGLDFSTSSFTVELWIYPYTGFSSTSSYFVDTRTSSATASWGFGIGLSSATDGRVSWIKGNSVSLNADASLSANSWNHLAYVRDSVSNTAALFANGNRISSITDSSNYNLSSLSSVIAARANLLGGFFNGRMSDIRILSGTALYDVNSTTYTIPNTRLANISNTSLLLNFNNATIFDQSSSNGFISVSGVATKNAITRYNSGSLFFNGNAQLVSNSTRNLNLSTSDFTIEGWFYSLSSTPASTRTLFTVGNTPNDGVMLRMDGLFVANSATSVTTSEWISGANYTATFPVSTWKHIAVTRKNGYVSTWVDGKRTTVNYIPRDLGLSKKLTIGGASNSLTNNFFGYIDDFRISNGVCLYDTNFVVPTSQITPDANTKFLLNTSNYDTYTNLYSLCSPFGTGVGESFLMNGSTDTLYTIASSNNFNNNNFSIEFWVYPLNMSSTGYWIRTDSRNNNGIFVGYTNATTLNWGYSNNGTNQINNSPTISNILSTWNHFVITKNDNVYTLYRNGSAIDSGYSIVPPNNGNNRIYIGSSALESTPTYTNAYISNVRAISGKNIFSSNFTPATAEFANVPNTKLLLNDSNYDNYTRVDSLCSPFGYGISDSLYLSGEDSVYTYVDSRSLTGTKFTAECWFYANSIPTIETTPLIVTQTPSDFNGFAIAFGSSTTLRWLVGNGSSWLINKAVTLPSLLNKWSHVALVKDGYVYTLYFNGSAIDGDYTNSAISFNNNRIQIGSYWLSNTNTNYFNGYVSNVRILSGVALYNSNFSPATADFTPVANTKLLLNSDNQNSYLSMSSLSSPYAGGAGSTYFSGTQYITTYHPTNFNFANNDFTIEFWVYPTKLSVFTSPARPWFNNANPINGGGIFIGYNSNTQFYLALGNSWNIIDAAVNAAAGTTLFDKWTHVCLTRAGSTFTLFQNGSSVWTIGSTVTIPNLNNAVTWGGRITPKDFNASYIANARIVNGTCLYYSNFNPINISTQGLFFDVVLQYDVLYPTLTYNYTTSKILDIRIMGSITQSGIETRTLTANTISLKNVTIDKNGVLTFPLTSSKSLTINGNNGLLIQGGSLNIGSKDNPIPSNITHNLIFGNNNGFNGLTANNNSMINVYGSYKTPYTTTTIDVPISSNKFTVVDNVSTNWLSGDSIAFVHPSLPSTTYNILTLSSFNNSNSFTTNTNTTVTHSALSSNNLVYLNNIPNFANLTRNVNIKGATNLVRGYIKIYDNSKVNINNASFQNFGINSTDTKGVTIGTNSSGSVMLSGNVFYGDSTANVNACTNSTITPIVYNLSCINNVFYSGNTSILFNATTLSSVLISNNFILSANYDGIGLFDLSGSSVIDNNYIYKSNRYGMLLQQSNLTGYSLNLYNLYSIGNTINGLNLLSSYLYDSNNINLVYNTDSGMGGKSITGKISNINSLYNNNNGISATFGTASTVILSNINASYNTNNGLYIDASNNTNSNNMYNVSANYNSTGIKFVTTTSGTVPLNLNNIYLNSNKNLNLESPSIYGTISGLSSFESGMLLSIANNYTVFDGICSYITDNVNPYLITPITRTGTISSSNLSPYSDPSTTSVVFRASPNSDYFTAPAFNISTDFTLEVWAKFPTLGIDAVLDARSGSASEPLWFGIDASSPAKLRMYTGTAYDLYASVGTISANVWHHLVWMRTNSRVYGFVDGVKVIDSATAGTNFANNVFVYTSFIGRAKDGIPVNKLLSNLRISNTAVYPTTGFIAPSSAPFKNNPKTVFLLQDPYLYGINGTNVINTNNITITGGTNYSEFYIKNSNIVRNYSSFIGYPISLDSVNFKQFFLENSQLSGNYGDVAFINTRDRVTGSFIFNNTSFSPNPLPFGVARYQPSVTRATGLAFTNYNKISSNNFAYLPEGTRIIDTIVYDTNSSDKVSERLIPSTTTSKLRSGSKFVAIDNGESTNVGVFVSRSSLYNGSSPRLMLKRNAAFGINDDIVIDTLSENELPNTFIKLKGLSPTVVGSAILEFYVDCDGTIGFVNVDSWASY